MPQLAGDPQIRADLLEAVARIEQTLGQLDAARDSPSAALTLRSLDSFRQATPPSRAATGDARRVRLVEGKLDEARAELSERRAHARGERTSPSSSHARAGAQRLRRDAVLEGPEPAAERTASARSGRPIAPCSATTTLPTATHLRNLGVVLDELERLEEAEDGFQNARPRGVREAPRHGAPQHRGELRQSRPCPRDPGRGQFDEAEELLQAAGSPSIARSWAATHPVTGQSIQLYALFLLESRPARRVGGALPRARWRLFSAINPRSFEVGKCDNGLALIAGERGDHAAAESVCSPERHRALPRATRRRSTSSSGRCRANQALEIAAQGRFAEAPGSSARSWPAREDHWSGERRDGCGARSASGLARGSGPQS